MPESNYRHRLVEGDELKALVEGAASIFHEPAWWRCVEEGLGYHCTGVLTENSRPLGLTVYFWVRRGPFRLIGSPLPGSFTPYQSPIWLGQLDERDRLDVLLQQLTFLQRHGFSSVEWRFRELTPSVESLAQTTGVTVRRMTTILLDIEPSVDSMWKKMESRGRNMIRKAEKAGVVVRPCPGTDEEIATFYSMLSETFARSHRTPVHPISFYRALIQGLIPRNRLLFLAAEVETRVLAMALFIHDDQEIFYTSGTSLPDVGAYAPNNLIQWHTIRFAIERGLRRYDLGGTGIPSIDRFKQSFGGRPHAYAGVLWQSSAMRAVASTYFFARPVLERARYILAKGLPLR